MVGGAPDSSETGRAELSRPETLGLRDLQTLRTSAQRRCAISSKADALALFCSGVDGNGAASGSLWRGSGEDVTGASVAPRRAGSHPPRPRAATSSIPLNWNRR